MGRFPSIYQFADDFVSQLKKARNCIHRLKNVSSHFPRLLAERVSGVNYENGDSDPAKAEWISEGFLPFSARISAEFGLAGVAEDPAGKSHSVI